MTFVEEIIKEAVEDFGYRGYVVEGHDTFGYLVTPSDAVLGVSEDYFGGATLTYEYVPSAEHGGSCACFEEPIFKTDAEVLKKAEQEGLAFAKRLGAKLYKNSEEWRRSCYWNGRGLREVENDRDLEM